MRLSTVPTWIRVASLLAGISVVFAGDLRLGRAEVKITPPRGMPMGGNFFLQLSTGVHDDLYCKSLAFEKDGERAAIVTCDVESLHQATVDRARRILERFGWPGDHVMITATHSHSGPEMTQLVLDGAKGETARIAKEYHEALPGKIAEAVELAAANWIPARAWFATVEESDISFNRRYLMKDGTVKMNPGLLNPNAVRPVGPIDPTLSVVYFDSPDSKPLATNANFALHTTSWGGADFSADYPGILASLLSRAKDPDMLTLFTQGCSGNINQVNIRSKEKQFGPGVTARIATILAADVMKTYRDLQPVSSDTLSVRSVHVKLPVETYTNAQLKDAREIVARSWQSDRTAFKPLEVVEAFKIVTVMERYEDRPIDAEIQVIALGDQLAWVGLPAEIFAELGMSLRIASPFPYTIINALANDKLNYIPNRKGFAEGSYEAVTALCVAGCGEELVDAATQLLVSVHAQNHQRQGASTDQGPGLFFREDFKETAAALPITQAHLVNHDLRLGLYGPGKEGIKKSHHDKIPNDPYYLWFGSCSANCAFTLRSQSMDVDLTGAARVRWRSNQSGSHQLRLIIKLKDGTWLVSEQADGSSSAWHEYQFMLRDVSWHRLDINEVLDRGAVAKPNLSDVEEIGCTDLTPGAGTNASSRLDWIEVYGKAVRR